MQICLCDAMPGYPHTADCPYPLYRGSRRMVEDWYRERDRIRAERARIKAAKSSE